MANTTKNIFVWVPTSDVSGFTASHLNSANSSDEYYNKVAFLSDSGEIATHGQKFGMSAEFKNRLGLSDSITTSNTLMSYIEDLGSQLDTLNASSSNSGSVDAKIASAINSITGGASEAFDTLKEIETWITTAQANPGSAAAISQNVAKVPTLEARLGDYTVTEGVASYTGAYYTVHNWINGAVNEVADILNDLDLEDTAESGQYVSAVKQINGQITVTREDLPSITIATGSSQYLTASSHQIGATVSLVGTTAGIQHNTTGTSYTATTEETIAAGLATASNIYSRLRADEVFVASALSTIDARISTVVAGATGDLDSFVQIEDENSYVSLTITQVDGKLDEENSSISIDVDKIYAELDSSLNINATENSTTYANMTIAIADGKLDSANSSLTINKTNILAKTSADNVSTDNDYITVTVTEANHSVTGVSVDFEPWEIYSSASV